MNWCHILQRLLSVLLGSLERASGRLRARPVIPTGPETETGPDGLGVTQLLRPRAKGAEGRGGVGWHGQGAICLCPVGKTSAADGSPGNLHTR